jgi:hypothetical protein
MPDFNDRPSPRGLIRKTIDEDRERKRIGG